MDDYYPILLGLIGVVILGLAGLPLLLRRLPLSMPIVLVALGAVLALLPLPGWPPDPRAHPQAVERVAGLLVLVSLMGAGLKLDTPLGLRAWGPTWRLLGIGMPLSILGIALAGWGVLGLPAAAALLLGAALAPTDPVLAADVQVGPPGQEEEDRVRFALTSEAGLNDGLAFPFLFLALAWAEHGPGMGGWLLEWLSADVAWGVAAGVGLGWLVGRLAALLLFRLPEPVQLATSGDGFLAVGVTLLAYGAAETAHAYGFVAVFCAAVTIRAAERGHDLHHRLHDFTDQVERLLMAALLVAFGAMLAAGLAARSITLGAVLVAGISIAVVRPLAGLLSQVGHEAPGGERLAIAFFGIRGVGTIYYLAYATTHAGLPGDVLETLWSVGIVTVTLSILVHGTTATPVMRRFGVDDEPAAAADAGREDAIGEPEPAPAVDRA